MSALPEAVKGVSIIRRLWLPQADLAIQFDLSDDDRITDNSVFRSIMRLAVRENLTIVLAALLG